MSFRKSIPFFSFLILGACVKDKPQPAVSTSVTITSSKKVYVINEGNYGSANASISLFDPTSSSVIENYFFSQNNIGLGDVAQSMTKINNDYYIVVNNSNKIVVCDEDLKIKKTITGLTSPRYIQQVSNHKAYVSDLYANAINIIDLNTGTKTGSISCPGKTEQMVMLYNKVYVTNTDKNYIYVVNAINDKIEDSINIAYNTRSLVIDKNDKIWALTEGDGSITEPILNYIDPLNKSAMWGLPFALGTKASNLCINGTKDTLFFLKNGICKFPITSQYAPATFIPSGSKNFYGLAVHPTNHTIYASDALDYTSPSNIYIYNSATGAEIKNFKAGFIANGFYFE